MLLAGVTKFEELGGVFVLALVLLTLAVFWLFIEARLRSLYVWWRKQQRKKED